MNKKGFAPALLVLLIAGVLVLGGVVYYLRQPLTSPQTQNPPSPPPPQPTPIVAPPQSPAPTPAAQSTPPPIAKQKNLTCAERVAPSQIQYSADDPRDYLNSFLKAMGEGVLSKDAKETIKCYFDSPYDYTPGNSLFVLDLDKNFTSFVFSLANWTPDGIVGVNISDPEFNSEIAKFYTRKINGQWKILDIKDPQGLLK